MDSYYGGDAGKRTGVGKIKIDYIRCMICPGYNLVSSYEYVLQAASSHIEKLRK